MGLFQPQTPRDRLVFALDVDSIEEAERFVKHLAPHVGMFKVGPRLFTNAGALVIDLIHGMGSSVFLDLKFHDIPASVAGAAREVSRQHVKMFTVHALGGKRMVRSVLHELAKSTIPPGFFPPICLAVTVLTSHAQDEVAAMGFQEPIVDLVKRLAVLAMDAGAQGIVSSAHELAALKPVLPEDTLYVTPGIRGPKDEVGDQSRVMTARQAVEAGATYVVVGRPIRLAEDPVAAAEQIVEDIARAHG